jgi:hypothetical protein
VTENQGEPEEVLNTLTENDFQDALKKMNEDMETMHTSRQGLLQG